MPPHWVCLFWSGSLWQCQDSVSLVHCTAVTYSHSLTHIYSSSITGLDTLRPQLVPRKNGWKTKPRAPAGRLCSVLSGALWVIMWPLSPLQTLSHTCPMEKMRTLHQGWGKAHCDLYFFLWVSPGGMCWKLLTAAPTGFEGTCEKGWTYFLLVSQ